MGDSSGKVEFVKKSMKEWISQIDCRVETASEQPQAAYAAFTVRQMAPLGSSVLGWMDSPWMDVPLVSGFITAHL